MKLFDKLFSRMGYVNRKNVRRSGRNFTAAKIDRLTQDWATVPLSSYAELRDNLRTIRTRSRELYNNNDYARKFIRMVSSNIIGVNGITFQNKAKLPDGSLDKETNAIIEAGFKDWGRREIASVTGRLSWKAMQKLYVETVARDGEVFVRLIRGFNNPYGFALQFLEADYVPESLNEDLRNGNTIRMGVEFDLWEKPIAYYVSTQHPGDYFSQSTGQKYVRIPASDMIHGFIQERPGQPRGIPWGVSAMFRLQMIGAYEEAEVVAARVGSTKMGIIKDEVGQYTGDGKDSDGNKLVDADPGSFFYLNKGESLESWDPQHPNAIYPDFLKSGLRGAASGYNVSYNSLASDLEGVNFSSLRQGAIDERDHWKMRQGFTIETLCDPIGSAWVDMAILKGAINIGARNVNEVYVPKWQPRGWLWVDPLKDVKFNVEMENNGYKTKTMILAEQGLDIEDVFEELKAEKELAESMGLEFGEKKPDSVPAGSNKGNGNDNGNGNRKNKDRNALQNV